MLAFRQAYGNAAVKEAFRVSRAALFRWQKALLEEGGKLDSCPVQTHSDQLGL